MIFSWRVSFLLGGGRGPGVCFRVFFFCHLEGSYFCSTAGEGVLYQRASSIK